MKNTMQSIIKHIIENFSTFGLSSVTESKFIESPQSQLTDGGKWLTLLAMQTLPGSPKGPYVVPDENNRSVTQVEIECKMRASDPSKDFPWNSLWEFRDKVYSALAGAGETGIVITRFDFTDPENPVEDGGVWFEVDRNARTPLERTLEDPNDPANKSIFLTYNVHWWKAFTDTIPVDPWVEALCQWSAGILGPGWTIYPGAFNLGFAKPSMMWSVANTDIEGVNRAAYKVKKVLVGHVLGSTPNQQAAGVLSITEGLAAAIKVPLSLVDRRYLTVGPVKGDYQAEALTVGQVRVELSRITMRPFDEVPVMAEVHFSTP